MLLLTCATLGWADELPVAREYEVHGEPETVLAQARRQTTRGAVLLGTGAVLGAGAVVILTVGRGDPGEVSEETDLVNGVRSVGGGVLGVGAVVTMLVGGNDISQAARLRRGVRADLAVLPTPGGASAMLVGRF